MQGVLNTKIGRYVKALETFSVVAHFREAICGKEQLSLCLPLLWLVRLIASKGLHIKAII